MSASPNIELWNSIHVFGGKFKQLPGSLRHRLAWEECQIIPCLAAGGAQPFAQCFVWSWSCCPCPRLPALTSPSCGRRSDTCSQLQHRVWTPGEERSDRYGKKPQLLLWNLTSAAVTCLVQECVYDSAFSVSLCTHAIPYHHTDQMSSIMTGKNVHELAWIDFIWYEVKPYGNAYSLSPLDGAKSCSPPLCLTAEKSLLKLFLGAKEAS